MGGLGGRGCAPPEHCLCIVSGFLRLRDLFPDDCFCRKDSCSLISSDLLWYFEVPWEIRLGIFSKTGWQASRNCLRTC